MFDVTGRNRTLYMLPRQPERECEMYVVLGVCLLLDFVGMTTWQLIDPFERKLESFPHEMPETTEKDIELLPQLEHCVSDNLNIWFSKQQNETRILEISFFDSLMDHKSNQQILSTRSLIFS